MTKHTLYDLEGHAFFWYSAKPEPLYDIARAASAWFGRQLH